MPLYIKSPLPSASNLTALPAVGEDCGLNQSQDSIHPSTGFLDIRSDFSPSQIQQLRISPNVSCSKNRTGSNSDTTSVCLKRSQPYSAYSFAALSSSALTKCKESLSCLSLLLHEPFIEAVCDQPSSIKTQSVATQVSLEDICMEPSHEQSNDSLKISDSNLSSFSFTAMTPKSSSNALLEAVARLEASADLLLKKMELHPEAVRKIRERKTVSNFSLESPACNSSSSSLQFQDKVPAHSRLSSENLLLLPTVEPLAIPNLSEASTELDVQNCKRSISAYFPNSAANATNGTNSTRGVEVMSSTSNYQSDTVHGLTDISMIPLLPSSGPSLSSTVDLAPNELTESDVSELKFANKKAKKALPVLCAKMRKLIKTLSDMKALPDVMDIFLESLPPMVKMTKSQLERLISSVPVNSTETLIPDIPLYDKESETYRPNYPERLSDRDRHKLISLKDSKYPKELRKSSSSELGRPRRMSSSSSSVRTKTQNARKMLGNASKEALQAKSSYCAKSIDPDDERRFKMVLINSVLNHDRKVKHGTFN